MRSLTRKNGFKTTKKFHKCKKQKSIKKYRINTRCNRYELFLRFTKLTTVQSLRDFQMLMITTDKKLM